MTHLDMWFSSQFSHQALYVSYSPCPDTFNVHGVGVEKAGCDLWNFQSFNSNYAETSPPSLISQSLFLFEISFYLPSQLCCVQEPFCCINPEGRAWRLNGGISGSKSVFSFCQSQYSMNSEKRGNLGGKRFVYDDAGPVWKQLQCRDQISSL